HRLILVVDDFARGRTIAEAWTREPIGSVANRSIPPGSLIPELGYPDVIEAAAWLCHVFGFNERLRIAEDRVQLTFGNGSMVVVEASPASAGESRHSTMVSVADVDAHHARAKEHGATIL